LDTSNRHQLKSSEPCKKILHKEYSKTAWLKKGDTLFKMASVKKVVKSKKGGQEIAVMV